MASKSLKPARNPFILWPTIKGLCWSALFFLLLGAAWYSLAPSAWLLTLPLLWLLYNAWHYWLRTIRFRKEEYLFGDEHVRSRSGGLFSDAETELLFRNVTHVRLRLPWLEHKLFGTGDVMIQSAGSGGVEAWLLSIEKPEETYNWLMKVLRQRGFKLEQGKLLQREQPSPVGVFLEVGVGAFFSMLFLLAILGPALTGLFLANPVVGLIAFILFLAVIIGAALGWVFRYLDLKRRTYEVYDDTVMYYEGFLTRHRAFMPVENLSDAETRQTLLDQLLSLYDVTISCQGAGQEVRFKNMARGKELAANIDRLIDRKEERAPKGKKATLPRTSAKRPSYETEFTGVYQQRMARALLPFWFTLPFSILIFPLFIVWLFSLIAVIIEASATRYTVKRRSLQSTYKFLTTREVEFSVEKVTGAIISENLFDRWLGTVTVSFWSIGSVSHLAFKHLPRDAELTKRLLAKTGFARERLLHEERPRFSLGSMLAATLPLTLLMLLLCVTGLALMLLHPLFVALPAAIILLYLAILFLRHKFYQHACLQAMEDYVTYTRGWLFRKTFYALYENVKNIETLQYPFSRKGSVRFDVAGESVVASGNQTPSVVTNGFSVPYLAGIGEKDEFFDRLFTFGKSAKTFQTQRLMEARQALGNTLLGTIILLVIILLPAGALLAMRNPSLALLPALLALLILGWVILAVRARRYAIEPYRVIAWSGILYKRQRSIVFAKVDHLNQSQGFLNKLFRNGTITIHTAGSTAMGQPELTIRNIGPFKEFYAKLEAQYR